jgi:uroporphyrinogen-III decarboxylase
MMTPRQRLMATLRGESVDRPAVCFYEIGGVHMDPADPDPFNIYNSPSWLPLLELAENETDLIRMRSAKSKPSPNNLREEFFQTQEWIEDNSRFTRTVVHVGGRRLTQLIRRDAGIDTNWVIEHPLKDVEDLRAYLQLPGEAFAHDCSVENLIAEDDAVGENGIVMVDTADPLCIAASLFGMEDYILAAFSEPELFHRLLEMCAVPIYSMVEQVAREFPGHLWRIYGPEYAAVPYLPPRLFEDYVVRYTGPVVRMIESHGGFARIHCHGRIRAALPAILRMGPSALDPVEPPPQGDITLDEVRREYGKDLVLFGNLEISDIENTPPAEFEKIVAKSLREGTQGEGRGFVLMPSACPYGREITPTTLANYRTMVRLVNEMF